MQLQYLLAEHFSLGHYLRISNLLLKQIMLKKLIALLLIGLVTNVAVFATGSGKNKQDDTAKVRAEIVKPFQSI